MPDRAASDTSTDLRSGCIGFVAAPDCLARQVRLHKLWQRGPTTGRPKLHRHTLPPIVRMTRNLNAHQLPLGGRWVARHPGLEVHDRPPSAPAAASGLAGIERRVPGLGPFAAPGKAVRRGSRPPWRS